MSSQNGCATGQLPWALIINTYTIDIESAINNCDLTMYADEVTVEFYGNDCHRANCVLKIASH